MGCTGTQDHTNEPQRGCNSCVGVLPSPIPPRPRAAPPRLPVKWQFHSRCVQSVTPGPSRGTLPGALVVRMSRVRASRMASDTAHRMSLGQCACRGASITAPSALVTYLPAGRRRGTGAGQSGLAAALVQHRTEATDALRTRGCPGQGKGPQAALSKRQRPQPQRHTHASGGIRLGWRSVPERRTLGTVCSKWTT
jgi:hypothetical protein